MTSREKNSRLWRTGTAWIALLGTGFHLFALNGRIIDERGNPLGSVSLSLALAGSHTASLGDGTFSFSSAARSTAGDRSETDPVRLSGSTLTFRIDEPSARVTADVFDLSGGRIASIVNRVFPRGTQRIDCHATAVQAGAYLMRVRVGRNDWVARVTAMPSLSAGKFKARSAASGSGPTAELRSAAIAKAGDTLLAQKPGYIAKRVTVNPLDDALGDLRLYDTAFHLTPETFPKIDGSTTTIPLTRIICCTLMNSGWTWRPPLPEPQSLWELVPVTSDASLAQKILAISKHSTTHLAFDSLILGRRDILLEARAPSRDELDSASAHGVTLEWRACGLDALVMVLRKDAAIAGLTTQNIKDIYSRKIVNWQELGGPDQKIRPYQREANSGSQEMMLSLIMKETPIDGTIPILLGMIAVFETLDYSSTAISFTPNYYKEMQVRDTLIRSLAVDGIAATRTTIASRAYPHCAEVYVVTRKGLGDMTAAAKLRDWLLAEEGQRVVENSGYVPILDLR